MKRRFPWNILGIDQTSDKGAIRRAYADALRAIDVDSDIAGYAELRRARDEALWLAAEAERGDAGDLGLGDFDEEGADDGGGFEPPAYADPYADNDLWWDEPPPAARPVAPPASEPLPDIVADDDADGGDDAADALAGDPPHAEPPARSGAQARAQAAWQGLLAILYPDGSPSDDGVTQAELDEGLAHLELLLAHAEEADLAEHEALDHALANLFADTWPRSAPFVEPANAALHWLDEAGQIEERYALRFLNARLKGMRFHEKVQQPDHPLNKAWVELSRPGQASLIDRFKVKRLEIDKLLTGIRQHYPELESLLAPERVASWEGSANASGVSDSGPSIVRWIVVVVLLLAVPRLCNLYTSPDAEGPVAQLLDAGPSSSEIDAEVADIFGKGIDMAEVRAADPVFADQLRLALNQMAYDKAAPIALTRRQALESGEIAQFGELVARAKLRRMWLGAARRQSEDLCRNIMSYDFTSLPLPLTDAERAEERTLLHQLLQAKVLNHEAKGGQVRFTIPGWAVTDLIARSKLDPDVVRAAMSDTDKPHRCEVEIALADVVLANTGRVSRELLQGL